MKLTVEVPFENIEALLAQLPPTELRNLLTRLQQRFETLQMMKLAESAFAEWSDEEDLYGNG